MHSSTRDMRHRLASWRLCTCAVATDPKHVLSKLRNHPNLLLPGVLAAGEPGGLGGAGLCVGLFGHEAG